MREQSKLLAMLSIIVALVLPLTTKLTVLPVSAALLGIVAWKWFFGLRQKKWVIVSGLILVFAAGVLYYLFPEMIRVAVGEITWRLFSFHKRAATMTYMTFISSQIIWTYWGKVGWIAVGLSWWVVDLLTAFGLFGIAIQIYKLIKSKTSHPQFNVWISTGVIALFTILAVARNGLTTGATQGRFLFPAIGALSLLMISGWHDVLPERVKQKFPLIVMTLMFILNLALWVFGVVPVYYQPFLD